MTTQQENSAPNGQQPAGFGFNPQQVGFGNMDPNMLKAFFPDVFGEPVRVSSYEDAVFAGHIQRGTELEIGTFSIMVLDPDAQHPSAEMVVRTNGSVSTDPSRLKKIGQAFLRWANDDDLLAAFEEAQQRESGAQNEAVMQQVAKGGL